MEVDDVIVWLQAPTHIAGSVEGWRKPSHAGHHGLGETVGNLLLSCYIETSQQFSAGLQRAELSKFEIINCNVYKLVKPENGNLGTTENGFDYINGGTYRDGIFGIKNYKYELYATKLAQNTYSQNGSYYVIFENDLGQASVHKNNS